MARRTGGTLAAVALALGLLAGLSAEATPLYAVQAAHSCDGCHVEPRGWANPPVADRRCTLDCGGCHVSPAGGGMRTAAGAYYGRQVLATWGPRPGPEPRPDRARFDLFRGFSGWSAGTLDASTLGDRYGTIPPDPFFDYGLDFRSAFFIPLEASDREWARFPMQADAYALVRPAEHLTLYASGGLMGSRRRAYDDPNHDTKFQALVAAREVFAKVDRLPYNAYLRAGRFAPAFGWKVPDHTSFTRRDLGFDQDRQVFGLDLGANPNYPYANLALFYQGFGGVAGDREEEGLGMGATAGYRDLAGHLGLSFERLRLFREPDRTALGVNYALNLYPLALLGEVARQQRGGVTSLYTLQEVHWLLLRGVTALAKYDGLDPDTRRGGDRVHRGTAALQWTPYPYLQIDAQIRRTFLPAALDEDDLLFMLHVFL